MELYEHQKKIINADPKRCGLWLGTGSGKTTIALMLAVGRTLVICPKTQFLDGNWQREKEKLNLDIDLTVLSKEKFKSSDKEHYDTIIVDEAHTVFGVTPTVQWVKKQPRPKASQLFNTLIEYITAYNPQRIYLVTATPNKSPMAIWAAAKILGVSWDWYKFRQTFYFPVPVQGREIWMARKDDSAKERLAKATNSLGYSGRLQDYFDVPEQTYKTVYVDLTKDQEARLDGISMEYPDPLVLVGKCHQIENGVLSGDEFNEPEEFDNNKDEKIIDYALEFPRMIIFAKYTAQIKHISKILKAEGYKVLELTGQTKDRGALFIEANASKECIVIAQTQISAGWELPDYPVMLFASNSYSIVDKVQAEGRILRANALKKNLYITLVARNGVDDAVYKALENKQDFIEKLYEKRG